MKYSIDFTLKSCYSLYMKDTMTEWVWDITKTDGRPVSCGCPVQPGQIDDLCENCLADYNIIMDSLNEREVA